MCVESKERESVCWPYIVTAEYLPSGKLRSWLILMAKVTGSKDPSCLSITGKKLQRFSHRLMINERRKRSREEQKKKKIKVTCNH